VNQDAGDDEIRPKVHRPPWPFDAHTYAGHGAFRYPSALPAVNGLVGRSTVSHAGLLSVFVEGDVWALKKYHIIISSDDKKPM